MFSKIIYRIMGLAEPELASKRQKTYLMQMFFVILINSVVTSLIIIYSLSENFKHLKISEASIYRGLIFLFSFLIIFMFERLFFLVSPASSFFSKYFAMIFAFVISLATTILVINIVFSEDLKAVSSSMIEETFFEKATALGYFQEKKKIQNDYRANYLNSEIAIIYAREQRFIDEKIAKLHQTVKEEFSKSFLSKLKVLQNFVTKNSIAQVLFIIMIILFFGLNILPMFLRSSMFENLQEVSEAKQKGTVDQIQIFASIQHELGNKIPSLNLDIQDILVAYSKADSKEGIHLQSHIRTPLPGEDITGIDTIEDVLGRMKQKVEYSTAAISSLAGIINSDPSKFNPEKILLLEFLKAEAPKYIRGIQNVEVRFEGDPTISLELDKKQFSFLLQNFISNAIKHGFTDQENKHFILFRLSRLKDGVLLQVINNGKAFPANFSIDDFKKPYNYTGTTGNTGIGGYIIANVLQNHDANLKLVDLTHEDPNFKVSFEITFNKNRKLI